jgi:hypothetical protein
MISLFSLRMELVSMPQFCGAASSQFALELKDRANKAAEEYN